MSEKTKNNTLISCFLAGLSFFSTGSAAAGTAPNGPAGKPTTTLVRYNDTCNGSLAWLSSTTETRDAANSAAVISSNNLYYGINQLDGFNVSRLIKFINANDKYTSLRGKLSYTVKTVTNKKGRKEKRYFVDNAKWKNLAKTQNALFTAAQEDFMCEVYLPECFQKLQKDLIKDAEKRHKTPVAVTGLNPVVLSLFARRYIKGPNSKAPFEAIKDKNVIEINSEAFIKSFCGRNEYLKKKALSAFNQMDLVWNENQIVKACSLAAREYAKYQAEHQTHLAQTSTKSINDRIKACRERENLTAAVSKPISKAAAPQLLAASKNKRQMG